MKRKFYPSLAGLFFSCLFLFTSRAGAQSETLSSGSFIINMGVVPQTVNNALKPYGMVYDLTRNYKVPVKWVIGAGKVKDGTDFTFNGVQYKGGTFIIPAEYRSAAVNARITFWTGQGVVGVTTNAPLTVTVTQTIKAAPRWTLDAANGAIAEGYLTNAGITLGAFPNAYNWKAVTALDCCDDFFVMPHADPTWATHGRLYTWNKDCLGTVWAACHAVSALENSINPGNTTQQMNFLTTRTAAVAPTPYPNNSLKLWTSHADGTVPYTANLFSDPIAQYMGVTDAAHLNGSEQIYIPKQSTDAGGATRWRPGSKIIAYDPTQANLPSPDLANGNVAALIVYGRGFDDPTRGYVMYEAGHSHDKGSANDVAAQRAFLNFSFFQVQPKSPAIVVTGLMSGMQINSGAVLPVSASATSPLSGVTFSFQWSSSCGGTFANASAASTNFTAPTVGTVTNCILTCTVTDNCGRVSYQSVPVTIVPPPAPPALTPDNATISLVCGTGSPVTVNVLANDSDPAGLPLTLTNVTGAVNGSVSFTAAGAVTFTPAPGFTGPVTLTYTACNTAAVCANSTLTISSSGGAAPAAAADAYTINEDAVGTFSVLANDAAGLTVTGITAGPLHGRLSINTDNTITYIPNTDYAGTDNFTYRVTNGTGGYNTATVSITITNDGCDGGTLVSGSGTVTATLTGDNVLWQQAANTNYGACNYLDIGTSAANTNRGRAAISFDLSAVPAGSTITSATLTMKLQANAGSNQTISAYRLTRAFTEGTGGCGGANNTPSSWNTATAGNNWTTAGGDFTGNTGTTPYASVNVTSGTATGTAYNWDLTALVNEWVIGTYSNFGLLMKSAETGAGYIDFHSQEATTVTNRPVLTINYTTCAAIGSRGPLAMPDTASTPNGTPVTIATASNDYYPVAGARTYTIVTPPASGTATIDAATGVITYTPATTFNGVRSLTYQVVHAGTGLSDLARVYINITNGNVVANNDNPAPALSGVAQTVNVKANDTDPDVSPLNSTYTVSVVVPPANGTTTVDASGNIIYTPIAGFTGTDVLTYRLCEPAPSCGTPSCATATVTFTVQNRVPVANNDNKTSLPCSPVTVNLLSNDTDPEAGMLTVSFLSALSNPAAGTLVNNNDGTVTFSPATGFLGTVTFTYAITDDGVTPQTSALATVTITIANPPNNPPVAVNDAESINMDETLFMNVRDNDSDPENQSLTIPAITIQPLHGTASVNPVNGLVEYKPNPGYYGTDVLTYRICDIAVLDPNLCVLVQDLCATATLTITILPPVNTTYAYNDEHSTWQDVNVSNNVLNNDKDLEGEVQVLGGFFDKDAGVYVTSGTFNVYAADGVTLAGTLTVAANGNFTFDPVPSFTGVVVVPYVISDLVSPTGSKPIANDTAQLIITVNALPAVSNSIIANNDEYVTPLNTNVNSSVTAYNDFDPQGNPFSVTGFTFDTDGNGTQDGTGTLGTAIQIGGVTASGVPVTNAGTLLLNADGTFTFNPQDDFTGSIEIVYTITDALGATTTAILHIDVLPDTRPGNDPPFAGDDFKYTNLNTPVSGNALANDSDPNAGNTIAATPQTTTVPGVGTLVLAADGSYTFTPAPGYTGPAAFPYTICDNQVPALCSNATLHFLVGIENSTDALNDENSTWQDVNVSGGVLANDFDAENNTQTFGSFLAQGSSPGTAIGTGATLSGVDKNGNPVANAGSLVFDANGNYTFDPSPSFTGTVTVPYSLCDNGNRSKCDTAYLTITVDPLPTTGINSVIANNDENTSYGAPVGGSLFVNDRDPQNDGFTVTSFTGGTVGTPGVVAGVDAQGNPVANAGTLTILADGSYTFTPAPGFAGSINVPYTITDARGATATAILHIDVLKDPNGPANDPPVAGDDFNYTTVNTPVSGSFVVNDSDPNSNPLSLNGTTINTAGPHTPIGAPVATAQGGTVQFYADGTYTYTPPAGYVGPDRVNYTICDVTVMPPQPLCSDAMIHLLVGPGISIAGKVWNDANGDVTDPGATEPETNAGGTLYVNLLDANGLVVATTPVAADGSYNFAGVNPGATYSIQLTTIQGITGQPAPATQLPAGWANTGESRNGTIDGGASGVIDARTYGYTNTVNYDFGIERLPNTDTYTTNIAQPVVNQLITLNGGANPPVLSGTDPEDCTSGCQLTARSVVIDAVPANAELYYNGVLVTAGQLISNLDPSLLQVKITNATLGSASTSFQYSFVDAAGKKDPTPATYTLSWMYALPASGLYLTASLQGNQSLVNWATETEINTDYFIVERSLDNAGYEEVSRMAAAGNSVTALRYGITDNITAFLRSDNIYYRIRLVDKDGRTKYSNIALIRLKKTAGVSAWPNPFTASISVGIYSRTATRISVRLVNTAGQVVRVQQFNISAGFTQVLVDNLRTLVPGTYILQTEDANGQIRQAEKFIKQ